MRHLALSEFERQGGILLVFLITALSTACHDPVSVGEGAAETCHENGECLPGELCVKVDGPYLYGTCQYDEDAVIDIENETTSRCGNGIVEWDEACDDGAIDDCGECNADCSGPGSGSEACRSGELCCVGACVDGANDLQNCGACGTACHAGQQCNQGYCSCGAKAASFPGATNACTEFEECCAGVCTNVAFDPRHCGTCDHQCAEPLCIAGACQCPGGTDSCDASAAACRTDLLSDATNCGGCGTSCLLVAGGPDCVSGSCSCDGVTCGVGTECCDNDGQSVCIDTQTSPFNCGGCGQQCAVGETCENGVCACQGQGGCGIGQVCCSSGCSDFCACGSTPSCTDTCCNGDTCIDVSSSRANCGACDNACDGDKDCVNGSCVCPSGTDCGTQCADLNSDASNCGACGHVCTGGEACCGGACVDTQSAANHCGACNRACGGNCVAGQCECLGTPVDLSSDVNHCGACGVSCLTAMPGSNVLCVEGSCVFASCISGYADCDLDPLSNGCEARVDTDPLNCGECGTDCQGGACSFGSCDCGGAANIDFQTDPNNCGSCGNRCTALHAVRTCAAGTCTVGACLPGYVDCDASSGCETDANVNGNCGACGVTCAANQVCVDASCQSDNVILQLVGGDGHTCARRSDGVVFCWGVSDFGQVGDGASLNRTTPTELMNVDLHGHTVFIASGQDHNCAVVANGDVYCWGRNDKGQLGVGTSVTESLVPVKVPGLPSAALRVDGGKEHSCALLSTGAIYCWGRNDKGQLGDGTKTDRPNATRTLAINGATDLCTGEKHSCALIAGGTLRCWGENGKYQLGDDSNTERTAPVAVTRIGGASGNLGSAAEIDCFHLQTCARLINGDVVCWGDTAESQLGAGVGAPGPNGTKVVTPLMASKLAVGEQHGCVISSGAVKCWGRDDRGQIANGKVASAVAVTVAELSNIDAIGLGQKHSCAASGPDVWCWGSNSAGALGDGTTTDSLVPVQVTWP